MKKNQESNAIGKVRHEILPPLIVKVDECSYKNKTLKAEFPLSSVSSRKLELFSAPDPQYINVVCGKNISRDPAECPVLNNGKDDVSINIIFMSLNIDDVTPNNANKIRSAECFNIPAGSVKPHVPGYSSYKKEQEEQAKQIKASQTPVIAETGAHSSQPAQSSHSPAHKPF